MPTSIDIFSHIPERLSGAYEALLAFSRIRDEGDAELTALCQDDAGELIACGSLSGRVLKQIAVRSSEEGTGACASVVSSLVAEAYRLNRTHLFLYNKPAHQRLFASLGFYPIVETSDVLMMENVRDGLRRFLSDIPSYAGKTGCIVVNCNPMTIGHQWLMAQASSAVDHLLIFVVSEDASLFPADDRFALVKAVAAQWSNVSVIRSGDYLVSRATFPTYFIKDTERCSEVRDDLDLALFTKRIAPELHICVRFIGQEPYCPVTRMYNERMKQLLPQSGVEVVELPRYRGISASEVRRLLLQGNTEQVRDLVPPEVYAYCKSHSF